jgi:hypothetical protein
MWAAAPGDVWLVGPSIGVFHFSGSGWDQQMPSFQGMHDYRAVWGTARNDVWLVGAHDPLSQFGPAAISYWDGQRWWDIGPFVLPDVAVGVWDSAPNNAWILGGTTGRLLHYDGNMFSTIMLPFGEGTYTAIWGTGSELFVTGQVGAGTIIGHFDGQGWNASMATQGMPPLNAIWGSGPKDVWFAGTNVIAHWDGSAVAVTPLDGNDLRAVWGSAPDDVFAGGMKGVLLHNDGKGWTPVRTDSSEDIQAIAGGGAAATWLGGQGLTRLLRTAIPGP